ncbi:MAG: amidohydrolase [Elusimicrobia bacterium]|nr:amidohydrolase [Elusimicrobiota bacterium]
MKNTDALQKQLVKIRRHIHQYPELGNQEYKTSAFITSVLRSEGIATKTIAGTGVIGLIQGKKGSGKTIALRADMDALPIHEQTKKSFSSRRPGIMHACGHDANTAIVIGAGIDLFQRRAEFSGTVKLVFQPNEESAGGAKKMIAAGALIRPAVDAIVGVHVSPWLKAGTLGIKYDEMMAAVDRFTIEIRGEGGHGAYPHLSVDAIVVATQVVAAIQTIVSRQISPVDPVVVSIGTITGGERYNIICSQVRMEGTVRTLNDVVRRRVKTLMERELKHITAAYGACYVLKYENLGNALKNSRPILEICKLAGESFLGVPQVKVLDKPSMGGEDFAEYLQKVPGCFIYFGTAPRKAYPWHHACFDIEERALSRGSLLLSRIAQDYLSGGAPRE